MLDILILEDDLPMAGLLVAVLSDAHYSVGHAINGRTGLAMMATGQPRLVLSDVHMPDVDGISFARLLRGRADLPQPPIVFMTADTDRLPTPGGSVICLPKPFDLNTLMAQVQALVAQPRHPHPSPIVP
ncbi:MAG TPA: response regulator [Herpetosiphonaceae bacterium]|nr:response regulator [Herpetosiphonaceae bacterium]